MSLPVVYINVIHLRLIFWLFVCLMVFNATYNNISVISWRSFYWWRKPKDLEKKKKMNSYNANINMKVIKMHQQWLSFQIKTHLFFLPRSSMWCVFINVPNIFLSDTIRSSASDHYWNLASDYIKDVAEHPNLYIV